MTLYIPILFGSIIVLYLKVYEAKKIAAVFEGYFDLRAFRRVMREESLAKGIFPNLLLFNAVITISAAVTYLMFAKSSFIQVSHFAIFGMVAAALILYYWLRKILLGVVSFFSEQHFIGNEINAYNKFFYQVLGILLLPIMLFINFDLSDSNVTWLAFFYNGLFILIPIVIVLAYLFKLIQEFRQTSQINISGYYLFLYFCTLEILPLIVFISWFVGKY